VSVELLDGLDAFEKELSGWLKAATPETANAVLETAAEALVQDVRKLPKPRSQMGGSHTHLLDTIQKEKLSYGWAVGWGKYYGPIVEKGSKGIKKGTTGKSKSGRIITWANGTRGMAAQPHLRATYDKNRATYDRLMAAEFNRRVFNGS